MDFGQTFLEPQKTLGIDLYIRNSNYKTLISSIVPLQPTLPLTTCEGVIIERAKESP